MPIKVNAVYKIIISLASASSKVNIYPLLINSQRSRLCETGDMETRSILYIPFKIKSSHEPVSSPPIYAKQ